jgi:hypothetical protein
VWKNNFGQKIHLSGAVTTVTRLCPQISEDTASNSIRTVIGITSMYEYHLQTIIVFSLIYSYYRLLAAWRHPCEGRFSGFLSQWYIQWGGLTYEECNNKLYARAWRSSNSMCQLFANISLSRDNKVCQHCSRENRVFANIRCGEKVDSCITHGTGLQV